MQTIRVIKVTGELIGEWEISAASLPRSLTLAGRVFLLKPWLDPGSEEGQPRSQPAVYFEVASWDLLDYRISRRIAGASQSPPASSRL